jgi:hypothetical protein
MVDRDELLRTAALIWANRRDSMSSMNALGAARGLIQDADRVMRGIEGGVPGESDRYTRHPRGPQPKPDLPTPSERLLSPADAVAQCPEVRTLLWVIRDKVGLGNMWLERLDAAMKPFEEIDCD